MHTCLPAKEIQEKVTEVKKVFALPWILTFPPRKRLRQFPNETFDQ